MTLTLEFDLDKPENRHDKYVGQLKVISSESYRPNTQTHTYIRPSDLSGPLKSNIMRESDRC